MSNRDKEETTGRAGRNRLDAVVMHSFHKSDLAWLHRRDGYCWEFQPSKIYHTLVHVTKYGTVYAIFQGVNVGKPFWIGRLHEGKSWLTWERELRSRKIEFGCGGEYIFPA